MADYEDGIFSNLPQRRRRADADNTRSFFREALGMYVPEGPLPPRPHASGKGGPSLGVSNAPPTGSASPVVTGTAAVGQTLSCDNGVWFNTPTSYTYQWLRDGANIAGATSSTYVVVAGDLGHAISCTVTARNSFGSTPATSNAVLIVAIPVNTVAPAITGTATVGSTLSCSQGTWTNSPTSYTYQWMGNGVNISGATASSYVVVTGDAGTSIRCTVTAWNATASGLATSNALAIAALPSAPGNTAPPVVTGAATVGSTLSCSTGTWTNSPTSYQYQWQRNGVDVSGATSPTYVTVIADGGTSVSCRVTATNVAGNTSMASNALSILGVPANTAAPVASGTLTVGSTLSVTNGTWTNSPTYTYQWTRGGTNISGATSSTYLTVSADGGTSVGCLVTATNASGSASAPSNTLAIAAGGATSVWSASDAAANSMTLTNGGLTVTPSGTANWGTVRGSITQPAGKLYVEFKTSSAVAGAVALGLANAGFSTAIGNYLGSANYSLGCDVKGGFNYPSTGFAITTAGGGFGGLGTVAANDVLAIAIDFSTQSIWFARNNVWFTGNPSTETLPFATFVAATVGALAPALSFINANAGVWTLQPTAASQKYTPPSGFSAWG